MTPRGGPRRGLAIEEVHSPIRQSHTFCERLAKPIGIHSRNCAMDLNLEAMHIGGMERPDQSAAETPEGLRT